MSRIFLYGAGGHAKVIIEALESRNITPLGLIDENISIQSLLDYPVYHSIEAAGFKPGDSLILSIGNNVFREQLSKKLSNVKFATAIHSSAVISTRSVVGDGTVIMPQVSVNSNSNIGYHCILNTGASVDHDCLISDFVHISPQAGLAGNVHVGQGTHIGIGASIIPNVIIGKRVTIGAGAVVIKDVPDYAVVVGNPGKIIKYNV